MPRTIFLHDFAPLPSTNLDEDQAFLFPIHTESSNSDSFVSTVSHRLDPCSPS